MNLPDDVEICKLCCLERGKLEVVYQMSTGEYYCTGCGGRVPGERYVMKLRCDCELCRSLFPVPTLTHDDALTISYEVKISDDNKSSR